MAGELATGMSVADVEAWPERLKKVTVEDIRKVTQKYLIDRNSVTGVLSPSPEGRRVEQPAHIPSSGRS